MEDSAEKRLVIHVDRKDGFEDADHEVQEQ